MKALSSSGKSANDVILLKWESNKMKYHSCQKELGSSGPRTAVVCACVCARGDPRRGGGDYVYSISTSAVCLDFLFSYKMLYAGRFMLVLATVAASALAYPNHLKAVVTSKESVPQESGVAASFGPFSAKAGIGEGGLYAGADSPLGAAGAGVGSGGLGASASTGGGPGAVASAGSGTHGGGVGGGHPSPHKPGHHQPTPFDGIFNIPISVLQAVNQYLNNRGPITKPVHRRRGHQPPVYKTVTPVQSGAGAGTEEVEPLAAGKAGTVAESHSSASSSSSVEGGAQHPVTFNKRVNYDDIFAIPISALRSVNHFLNGKK